MAYAKTIGYKELTEAFAPLIQLSPSPQYLTEEPFSLDGFLESWYETISPEDQEVRDHLINARNEEEARLQELYGLDTPEKNLALDIACGARFYLGRLINESQRVVYFPPEIVEHHITLAIQDGVLYADYPVNHSFTEAASQWFYDEITSGVGRGAVLLFDEENGFKVLKHGGEMTFERILGNEKI